MSAVIKVRSETTEVTKAELSEATPSGRDWLEVGNRWCLVGFVLKRFPWFFLVVLLGIIMNYGNWM